MARKHRAPKGALRPIGGLWVDGGWPGGQKAPSAKRCIMTNPILNRSSGELHARKHRAPKGALRRAVDELVESIPHGEPESTERQKVH